VTFHHQNRGPGYTHHGIYVNDRRVIDFSKENRGIFWQKIRVHARTLAEFERQGKAKQVGTTEKFLGGLGFWPGPEWAYAPEEIEMRAEALCHVATTRGAYRLSGSNCDT
jgi:Lecithin retinol acyltransferase